jgi:hypothetical protein
MKNTKAILAGALMVPVLALTGGIAYASAATPSHPAPARATVTATAQHPLGQAHIGWCDWRYTGYRGDWHGYGCHPQAAHQHRTHRHHGYQHRYGYQHRSGYRTWGNKGYGYQGTGYQGTGYQGTGYQGTGYQGTGYQGGWGHGSGCCRNGW